GGSDRPAVEMAVEHKSRADASRDGEIDDVARPPPRTPTDLSEGTEVRIVVDMHRHIEAVSHFGGYWHTEPARQQCCRSNPPFARVDWSGQSQTGAKHFMATDAGVVEHRFEHRSSGVEPLLCRHAVDVHLFDRFGENGVREIGDCDAQVGVAEV